MNDYDFSVLNDKEFENIVVDLISRDKDKKFERFKAGKDGGIDGRFFGHDGKEEIIQCKHYLKTGYQGLIASLKKKNANSKNEIDKVKLLNPKKYIFVTSLPLSADNKKKIKELFSPYIKNDNDIYGQEDLNDILKLNSDIEENHYKLWISSITVLNRILHNAIKGRSEFLIDEIKEKIKYYVLTNNHKKAIQTLEKSHNIIIAGEPGIGKTTLAEQICLSYSEKGFEFCAISESISEAESIFIKDEKQIFYFDDFLGSNYLQAIENHKDSQIIRFMNRVKNNKNKRFILTSRTNIINQGISLSDNFRTSKLDKNEFIITVNDLSNIDKALILYNHIYHSNLAEEFIDVIYEKKRYKKIINHKNFNPRLIEFITDTDRVIDVSEKDYWKYIESTLNNPSEVWAHTFDKQSDEYIRNIVLLTVFNGNTIKEESLKNAYYRLNKLMQLTNQSYTNKDFNSIIPDVVKYFLNRMNNRYKNTIEYSLFNPSIADFILNRYKNDDMKIPKIFSSLQTIESLKQLNMIGNVNKALYGKTVLKLYNELDIGKIDTSKDTLDYSIKIIYLANNTLEDVTFDKTKTIEFYAILVSEFKSFSLIDEFVSVLITLIISDELEIENYNFIIKIIELLDTFSYDVDRLNSVISLIDELNIEDTTIISSLNMYINDSIALELDGIVSDIGFDDVEFEHNEEGYAYARESDVENYIDIAFDEIFSPIKSFKCVDIDTSIVHNIDIIEISQNLGIKYMDNWGSHDNYLGNSTADSFDNIDDIFER